MSLFTCNWLILDNRWWLISRHLGVGPASTWNQQFMPWLPNLLMFSLPRSMSMNCLYALTTLFLYNKQTQLIIVWFDFYFWVFLWGGDDIGCGTRVWGAGNANICVGEEREWSGQGSGSSEGGASEEDWKTQASLSCLLILQSLGSASIFICLSIKELKLVSCYYFHLFLEVEWKMARIIYVLIETWNLCDLLHSMLGVSFLENMLCIQINHSSKCRWQLWILRMLNDLFIHIYRTLFFFF